MDVTLQCLDRLESGVSDGLSIGATHVFGVEDGPFPSTRQEKLLCIGAEIAQEIRDDIQHTLHFTTSVGIATNKLLAKLASPQHKPDGQTMIPPRSVHSFMHSFRVDKIRGLGGKLGKRLLAMATPASQHTEEVAPKDEGSSKPKVTAGAIIDEYGLPGLQKAFGVDTGRHIFTLCMGNDGNDPVNMKKVLLAQLNSVKSFEQRTGYLTSESMFHYWLRILCEEMVWRFDEEQEENQRIPTQFTLSCDRSDRQKKLTRHFAVPTTVDATTFYAAASSQITDVSTILPCAHVVLSAKDFVSTVNPSVKITHFFKETNTLMKNRVGPVGQVDDGAEHGGGGNAIPSVPLKPSRAKLGKAPAALSIMQFFAKEPTPDAASNQGSVHGHNGFFCTECNKFVQTTAREHADHHLALALSSQWNDDDERPVKKRSKQGPMDFFLRKV
ncbi:hypothetical protein, variant [Aphanomyces invadans]|nr:hypothetical protein, variant [Aphanomyces invadans]ETW07573.1 hypothetical protein, variant [Aphanomyces invadans]|eukprot:XP_008863666.1 hypothetical protein, variant [Aphanomyces invadans]